MSHVLTDAPTSVEEQRRIEGRSWATLYVCIICVSGLLGLIALGSTPKPLALPMTVLLMATVAVAVRPIVGVYLIGFFTLCTDASISPWYPFTWPFSTHESILYLSDSLNLSPLELLLLVTAFAFSLHVLIDRTSTGFVKGRLFWPVMAFAGFLFLGLLYGLATGGDRYAATWEFRPLLYLPVVYILVSNLLTTRRQYHRLAMLMLGALVVHSLLALQFLLSMSHEKRSQLESLVDHGSAVQMSVVLLLAFAVWLLPGVPRRMRWCVTLAAVPISWVWFVSQRRAAVIGLAAAVILLGIILSQVNPRRLRIVGPVFVVIVVGYLAAFWGSEGSLGFPAQAVKSVISPTQVSSADQGSDVYRQMENFDTTATIHAKPITGLGFGHKFYRPVQLPDISKFFPFFEYIPHNSVLWIWIKAGVGGFVAMFFLFGAATRAGVRSTISLARGRSCALAFAGVAYVVMYFVFAYVDIAWDMRSMVCIAIAFAFCSDMVALPETHPVVSRARPTRPESSRPARSSAVAASAGLGAD
jgi:O-antigen ligase